MDQILTTKRIAVATAGAAAAALAGVMVARKLRTQETIAHVRPNGDGWRLEVEGSERSAATFDVKDEAVDAGRELARGRAPSQLVIHRVDGTEQERHRYGAER